MANRRGNFLGPHEMLAKNAKALRPPGGDGRADMIDRLGGLDHDHHRTHSMRRNAQPRLVLRDYQASAATAIVDAFQSGENPVASLPTGSGKSVIIPAVINKIDPARASRFVVTVPSRELAEQNERALRLAFSAEEIGVVCASLGRREFDRRIIVGTPQSLTGKINFSPAAVVVDEAHQMPLHRGSWFARMFAGLPIGRSTRRIGLSATTFRSADGAIYGNPASWFSVQPFEIPVGELVEQGYLAPVRYVAPDVLMTTRGVGRSAGDYVQSQLVSANLDCVDAHVKILIDAMADRRRAIVFAVTVEHANAYVDALATAGERAVLIVGAMSVGDRRKSVTDFKSGRRRIAVTVAAALTGFDVPDLDLIASCRPTLSPIIHTQSIGRGTRPADGKVDCLVLDFAGNVPTFGPAHAPHFDPHGQPLGGVAPWRPCPICATYNHFSSATCDHCGATLAVRRQITAADLEFGSISWHREMRAIEALVAARGPVELPVESLALHAYRKKSAPNSVSCMISFSLGGDAIVRVWTKQFDTPYWIRRWSDLLGDKPATRSLQDACHRRDELVRPAAVSIEKDGEFWRVVDIDYSVDPDDVAPVRRDSQLAQVSP